MGVRCLRTQESVGVLRRLQVEAWGPSCSRLATSQEGAAHAKGEGGRGGRWWLQSFFKLGRSSLQSAEKETSGLLVVAWEATNVYCAFNVLEVDLLQGVRKSGSWMHASDSGSHLGVGEARVRHGGSPR